MKVLCRSLEEPTVIVSYLASEEHFLSLGRFFLTAFDKKKTIFFFHFFDSIQHHTKYTFYFLYQQGDSQSVAA